MEPPRRQVLQQSLAALVAHDRVLFSLHHQHSSLLGPVGWKLTAVLQQHQILLKPPPSWRCQSLKQWVGRECCDGMGQGTAFQKCLQHPGFLGRSQLGCHGLQRGPQASSSWSIRHEAAETGQAHHGTGTAENSAGNQVQPEGMGHHHTLTAVRLGPGRLVRFIGAVAPFKRLPVPALVFESPLPGAPDRGISGPAMDGDHLVHRQGRAWISWSTVSSGRSRRSTSRRRAVPSGTVGGRIATLSRPPSSRAA